MELKLLTKLAIIDQVMHEVLTDEQRQEISTRVAWLMLGEEMGLLQGTIWDESRKEEE